MTRRFAGGVVLFGLSVLAACSEDNPASTEYQTVGDAEAPPTAPPTSPPSVGGEQPRRDAAVPGQDVAVEPTPDAGPNDPRDAASPPPDTDGPVDPPPPPADAGAPPAPDGGEPPPPPPPDVPPGDAPANVGWVGGSCAGDADCDYENAFCLGADEGFPNGTCSLDCDRLCPDQDGSSVTFCVDGLVAGGGACVQQCDYGVYPTGCRPGYGCRLTPRYNDDAVRRQVCLPGAGDPPADNPCADELNRRRLSYIAADNPNDHPEGAPELTCDIEGPLLLRSPIGEVDYRYVDSAEPTPMFMGCDLAIALDDLSAYMRELDIVELVHIGTYNCRVIAGSDSLSMHGLGLAIDIHELRTADGATYNVEDDWEPGSDNPQSPKGRFLYEFGMQMFTRGIFNIVLTPNYNEAHYNHFHVDLTPGGKFIGRGDNPWRGVYPNVSGD